MDSARVKLNRQPWSSDANQATLPGAGVHWLGPNQWRASAVLVGFRVGVLIDDTP